MNDDSSPAFDQAVGCAIAAGVIGLTLLIGAVMLAGMGR